MIEKYENENNAESTNVYKTAAQKLGGSGSYAFTCGGFGSSSGTFVSAQVGAGSTNTNGYLPNSDGYYYDTPALYGDPLTWAESGGALSDFDGKSNSQVIKNILNNGTVTSYRSAPIAYLMNAFNSASCSSSVNQGYTDWYIPSCGQLGLIWIHKTDLDNALTAIGGTKLAESSYWSSSEWSTTASWSVSMYSGKVGYNWKSDHCRIRLVRDFPYLINYM